MKFLNKFRTPHRGGKTANKVIVSLLVFLLGGGLGALSKWLDTVPVNELPAFMRSWDIAKILSLTPIWALIALAIALFSNSPLRAAINASCFFAGVLTSYCLCSVWLAGFMLDKSYLMIWVTLAIIAFPLGFIVWYARGRGLPAIILSAVITAYFILQAFGFDKTFSYFELIYGFWGIAFLAAAILMLYRRFSQTLISTAAAIAIAYLIKLFGIYIPYVM